MPSGARSEDTIFLPRLLAKHWSGAELRRAVKSLGDSDLVASLPDPGAVGVAEFADRAVAAAGGRGRLLDLLRAVGRERPLFESRLNDAARSLPPEQLGALTRPIGAFERLDLRWGTGTAVGALSILILAAHVHSDPELTSVELLALPSLDTSGAPLLYRAAVTRYYFTTGDLLAPPAAGLPRLDFILIDEYAADEWVGTPPTPTWHSQIASALGEGASNTGAHPGEEYLRAVTQEQPLARGSARLRLFAPGNDLTPTTGLRGVISIATKTPPVGKVRPEKQGLSSRFEAALDAGLDSALAEGAEVIGVPSLETVGAVGDTEPVAPADHWLRILRAVHAARGRFDGVVIGGWALTSGGRERNRDAFSEAWRAFRLELAGSRGCMPGGPLRPALLVLAGATAGLPIRSVGTGLAIGGAAAAGLLAFSVGSLGGRLVPSVSASSLLWVQVGLVFGCTAALQIIRRRGGR